MSVNIDIKTIFEIVKFIWERIKEGKSKNAAINQAVLKFNLPSSIIQKIFEEHGKSK